MSASNWASVALSSIRSRRIGREWWLIIAGRHRETGREKPGASGPRLPRRRSPRPSARRARRDDLDRDRSSAGGSLSRGAAPSRRPAGTSIDQPRPNSPRPINPWRDRTTLSPRRLDYKHHVALLARLFPRNSKNTRRVGPKIGLICLDCQLFRGRPSTTPPRQVASCTGCTSGPTRRDDDAANASRNARGRPNSPKKTRIARRPGIALGESRVACSRRRKHATRGGGMDGPLERFS